MGSTCLHRERLFDEVESKCASDIIKYMLTNTRTLVILDKYVLKTSVKGGVSNVDLS